MKLFIKESTNNLLYHSVFDKRSYNYVLRNGITTDDQGWVYLSEKPYKGAYKSFQVTVPNEDLLYDWEDFWLDDEGNEIDFDHTYDPNNKYYMYYGNIPKDYVIEKNNIKESIEKVDDILVMDYAGDLVNILLNKPKVYRICYDVSNDVYGIGDAYKYIHGGIEKLMRELGYEPDPETEKGYNYRELTFVPYDVKDDKWQVGGFVGERDKALYIPSGFLLYSRVSSPEDYIPDLYDVLKRRGLISKHLDESQIKSIKKTAQKRLNDCYRRFDEIIDIYEENGFRLTDPNFHGYEDFKSYSDYFIKNPKSWGFRPDFDGLFVDTVLGRNMKAFDLYIGEDDDRMSVYWMWSDVMSSQSAIYKELMNTCKEYNIPYSTFYDL